MQDYSYSAICLVLRLGNFGTNERAYDSPNLEFA
jgi:hypothetical protein